MSYSSILPRLVVILVCIVQLAPVTSSQRTQSMPFMTPGEISIGDTLLGDLVIYTPEGKKTTLLDVVKGKYTVLVTGCLTCPVFHKTYPGTEAIYADYKNRDDIQFFFIYKSLAHPELNGYVQPVTLDERLKHIVEAKRVLGTTIPWLCDGADNAVRQAFNLGPNSDMIIDPNGKLIHAVKWTKSDALRREIASLIGDSKTHTTEADLKLVKGNPIRKQRSYDASVLPKPKFSSQLVPVKVVPISSSKEQYYIKPRVEVDQNVLKKGTGEMYLGFFPDPILDVHWNNLVDPVKYELILPDGMKISPAEGSARKVKQESDGFPREFKLEVASMNKSRTAELVFHYYACSKSEGWCKPVSQKYRLEFVSDPDGGWTNGRSFRYQGNTSSRNQQSNSERAQRQPTQQRRNQSDPRQIRQRILESDQNGDRMVTREELPEQMRKRFDMMDLNGDGHITVKELDTMLRERFGRQRSQ